MRLDKAVALAGLTRTEAKRAIAAGRVRVNGAPVRNAAMQVSPENVTVDGAPRSEIYARATDEGGIVLHSTGTTLIFR